MKQKILLIEPDRSQAEVFANWLREEGYAVEIIYSLKEVHSSISREKFDILLIDLDYPETTEVSYELCRTLKKDPRFQELSIAVFTYKKDGTKIASALDSGVDSFVLKPFDTDTFLERIKTIFKEIELKKEGRKSLDLNYINFLIRLTNDLNRNDFFLLAPVIFNRLIMNKIRPFIGDQVIMVLVKRTSELIGEQYPFMRALDSSNGLLLMNGVDKDSMGVCLETLAIAFRDYVYTFLQLIRVLTSTILFDRGKGY